MTTPESRVDANPPQHTLSPTTRFSDRAEDYARYRPSYPAAAIDAILDGLGPAEVLTAADVGAGTGISARLLADRGVCVFAIEPNAAMRGAAAPHPRVEWRDAAAELTGLEDDAVDLVVCAQAFHWFDPTRALREFHRILRPRGRLALMWNNLDESDACSAGYRRVFIDAGAGHLGFEHDLDPRRLVDSGCFIDVRTVDVPSEQHLDADGLIGRAMSASYAPKLGPRADRLRADLDTLHRRFADDGGKLALRYRTRVYLAVRR